MDRTHASYLFRVVLEPDVGVLPTVVYPSPTPASKDAPFPCTTSSAPLPELATLDRFTTETYVFLHQYSIHFEHNAIIAIHTSFFKLMIHEFHYLVLFQRITCFMFDEF